MKWCIIGLLNNQIVAYWNSVEYAMMRRHIEIFDRPEAEKSFEKAIMASPDYPDLTFALIPLPITFDENMLRESDKLKAEIEEKHWPKQYYTNRKFDKTKFDAANTHNLRGDINPGTTE